MSHPGKLPKGFSKERTESVCESKSISTSNESASNAGEQTTSKPSSTSQSVSSYSMGSFQTNTTNTPTSTMIPMRQPSQFSNQNNSNSSGKTETPFTTPTVSGELTTANINIPPRNLFGSIPSPLADHPSSYDLPTHNTQSSLSSSQDSNEEIFPSPPPFTFLSPTVLAYRFYYQRDSNKRDSNK